MGNKSAKRVSGFLGTSALTRPLFALGAATALLGAGPAYAIDANTLPQGPNVVGGKDSFAQSGNTLNVNQSTKRTVIDWRSFDIGSKAQVNFSQPGTSSIAVNRVNSSANPTQIEGGLHANGQVWILNPNGVFFGKTAHVDAAGVVASTANIDTKAFMAGSNTLQMTGADHGAVENQGNISVGQAGLAAFVAPSVRNSGTINATVGKVALAAGTTYTLDLAGDHLVELGLGSVKAVVDNSGKIVNPGGTIALTAKAASQVVSSVVNVSGTVSASSVTKSGGTITLGADNVTTASTAQLSADAGTNGNGGTITSVANNQGNYAGSFSAKGGSTSGNGGSVETSGKSVHVDSGIKVNTLASNGKTGNWTLDPDNLMVQSGGSGSISSGANDEQSIIDPGTVVTALNSTDVTLQARTSISVEDAIDASGNANKHNLTLADQNADNNLTINLDAAITLKAGATLSGQGTVVNVANTGKIQNGIDVALAGGATVNVAAGTYNENLTINKSGLTLLSNSGRDATTINGQGNTAVGTVNITTGANNFTLGDVGHGFTIVGIDHGTPGVESAGVYLLGTQSGAKIVGNRITASGDYGLLTSGAVNNLTIDNNIFDGVTFSGGVPGDNGFTNQFTVANVPRQLVTVNSGGSGLQFTNNQVTGTAGGINSSGQEQGNTLVTLDSNNVSITGNLFAGTTDRYGSQLRARGSNVTISANTFDSANLGDNAGVLELNTTKVFTGLPVDAPANLTQVMAANTFENRAVWDATTAEGNTDYVVGVSVSNAVAAASAGDTVNVEAGNYTLSSTLNLGKSINIVGAGEDSTVLNSSSVGNHGIYVIADDVTLSSFTLNTSPTGTFGIKVQPDGQDVTSGRVHNFSIDNVTINGAQRNGLDLFGIIHADIDNVTVKDSLGTGIAISNSSDVTITGTKTSGNNVGLSITQRGDYYTEQVNDINIDDSNSFSEAVPIYLEDSAAAIDFGTVNVAGFNYAVVNKSNSADVYTWFQKTQQNAIDFATSIDTAAHSLVAAVEGWTGSAVDNVFTIGTSSGGTAMGLAPATAYAADGATINVLAGDYTGGAQIRANDVTLQGVPGARILSLTNGMDGVEIFGNGVTVQNLEFAGPADQSYLTYNWGSTVTRGIFVMNGAQNFLITNNNIHGLRNDILVDGRNTGTISNNIIDNSKSGISVQYTDGTAYDKSLDSSGNPVINITGNSEGQYGNEWGVNFHLNGYWNGVAGDETHPLPNPVVSHTYLASAPTAEWQQGMLDLSADNGGMSIYDQAYQNSNRTSVTVSTTGSDTNQGSPLSSLASIQVGVNAVVAGGTVNVLGGDYTMAGQLTISKSLSLVGAGVGVTNITSNSTGYGIAVEADDVSLKDFTYHGPTKVAGSTYGIKVSPENTASLMHDFDIENVTIDGGYRTGLDLNGVVGATIKNVNVSNIVYGNGIGLTNSANVTITGSTTTDNAWGGLALYQNDKYAQQLTGITVDGTNTFNEANGIYAQNQSLVGTEIGSIDLTGQGIQYIAQLTTPATTGDGTYTFFQKTEQGAVDLAVAFNTRYGVTAADVQGYAGTDLDGNNIFYVGTGSNSVAMSIGSAVSQATTGGTVNVDAGTYAEDVAVGTQLSFNFGGSGVTVNSLTVGSGGAGSTLGGNLTATGAVALNGATTVNGNLKAASFTSGSTLALVGDLTAADGVTFGGASTVTGDIAAKTFTANGALALNGDLSASGAALFNGASSVNGNIQAASITANGSFGLNGNAKASGAIALNGANTLSGNLTGGSIALGATTLAGSTSLNTSGSNGAIQVASVNGNQALSLNAGTGTVSLGNVGATTRLASLSDASKTTLTGSTYNAGSLLFGGDVTLTAATTTLSTGGGDITFKGDIFGTADGAQSLVLSAGTGTGSPSANGNITLDNAGTSAVWLGDVTVSGNNFTADTVYVGGNYTSTLTGNQVFAADTLHTRGNVDSTVGGDASGHIDADGDVNINAGGDVSGTIGGNNVTLTGDDVNANVTAQNNATITGNTVEGSYNAGNTAGIVAHDNVNAAVNATNLELAAAGGSVDGTWTNYTITGSGIVYLNGDPQIGVNPAQLVVEGFTLPAGTTIGANGQLILPQGVLLGLLSPGGGKPKMILVHTVQELGQLLADGYSVIVIDLSGKDKDKPIQLASN